MSIKFQKKKTVIEKLQVFTDKDYEPYVADPSTCQGGRTMMKFFRAISRVTCLSGEKTNVSKTISVLVLRVPQSDKYPEDEDRNGLRNVGLLTAQPFDPADSPRKLHHLNHSWKHC
jgi:hypothetical protein